MPIPYPPLDDRRFQDIVDEAKKRIPHYCKEWTDHNVSDPGVTMIELFAWMTDMLLYRLNRVPELHYVRFMEMLGITLKSPQPAKVPVTFWLSAPQTGQVTIPEATEVSSIQTERERPIIFSTDEDLVIHPPVLKKVYSRMTSSSGDKKSLVEHNLRRLEAGFEGGNIFTELPQLDDAIYFGFENDLSYHILGFEFDFDPAGGAGIDPTMPPYVWEASIRGEGAHWETCAVEMDTTRGMNGSGRIQIHLPAVGKQEVNQESMYWVRARVVDLSEQMRRDGARPYRLSPRLRKMSAGSWGGTVPATHAQIVQNEFLGRSDGTPGQRYFLKHQSVLLRKPGQALIVQPDGEPQQEWQEVTDFADSWANDQHFTLDNVSGELRLGPAIRQQDGTIKLYGAVPPRGANLLFSAYCYGGGQEGNVQKGILTTLKTAIPYVARVSNRFDASGGLDAETLESAMMRAPQVLRSRGRAVTEADFEFLAREALPACISRVKCLQPTPDEAGRVIPGQIYLLVIPSVARPEGYLSEEMLTLRKEDIALLSAYVDDRRLLTTKVDIRPPAYHWVSVKVQLREKPGARHSDVERDALSRLYRYLNPVVGGNDGKGWKFGRDLFASDVYQALQGIPDVQFIRALEMRAAKPATGEPAGDPIDTMELVAHGVIASGKHQIEFI